MCCRLVPQNQGTVHLKITFCLQLYSQSMFLFFNKDKTSFIDQDFYSRRLRRLPELQVSWDASIHSIPKNGARWTRQQMLNFTNAAYYGSILGCLGYLYSLGTRVPLSLPLVLFRLAWTRAFPTVWLTTGVKAFALFSDFCVRGNAHYFMSALINSPFSFELLELEELQKFMPFLPLLPVGCETFCEKKVFRTTI